MIKSTNPFYDGYTLVEYEFNTLCDKNCSYCYNLQQHDKRFGSNIEQVLKDFDAILSADNPYLLIVLIGGETLILPEYDRLIDFIAEKKKPETKVLLCTHGDHEHEFFKAKMDKLKVFGDMVKVQPTIHWEGLNRERFKKNMKYINDNFKYKTMYFLLTPEFLENEEYIDGLLEDSSELTIYGLIFDGSENLDLLKQVNLYKKLEKYNNRMENVLTLNGQTYPHNIGMNELYKATKYSFTGRKCTLQDYDVDTAGNVSMNCNGKILFNLREGYTTDMFNVRQITCEESKCTLSLFNLVVE